MVTDRTEIVGIEGLTSAGFYREDGSGSHENKKDFEPNLINAVVVIEDQFTRNNPNCDTMVILTNGPVSVPIEVYDGYDAAGKETGIRKFREKIRQESGNKRIVFDGGRFAIFEAYELLILCGRNVRKPGGIEESISKEDILFKYGTILV